MVTNIGYTNYSDLDKSRVQKRDSQEAIFANGKNDSLENETKSSNPFGEAATLELSGDCVKAKSVVSVKAAAANRTLKVGSRGDDVKQLQTNLNSLGYSAGTPDGIFGNGTKSAVVAFQKTYGLSSDGIAGNQTQSAISTALYYKNHNILSKGQSSTAVANLQSDLISLGFLSGKADGAFGARTEEAVKAFQRKYNLTVDGLAGSGTRNKIAEVKKGSTPTPTPTPNPGNGTGTVRNVPINTNYKNNSVNQTNADHVYSALINAGFTKEAAAGVMGNLDVEHAFSTDWSGDQGSVGIAQWRGDRKTNLENYAKNLGKDATDIAVQTAFMIESDMKSRLGEDGLNKLKTMTDYIDAADYFCDKFESPSSYKDKASWENGKYGPNYAQHGGEYMIKWERYTWSDQLQKYELDLGNRRSAAYYWYNNK